MEPDVVAIVSAFFGKGRISGYSCAVTPEIGSAAIWTGTERLTVSVFLDSTVEAVVRHLLQLTANQTLWLEGRGYRLPLHLVTERCSDLPIVLRMAEEIAAWSAKPETKEAFKEILLKRGMIGMTSSILDLVNAGFSPETISQLVRNYAENLKKQEKVPVMQLLTAGNQEHLQQEKARRDWIMDRLREMQADGSYDPNEFTWFWEGDTYLRIHWLPTDRHFWVDKITPEEAAFLEAILPEDFKTAKKQEASRDRRRDFEYEEGQRRKATPIQEL